MRKRLGGSPTSRGIRWSTNEEQQTTEEPDEMEDLDVSQQKAEDVKGGAIGRIEPRFPGTGG